MDTTGQKEKGFSSFGLVWFGFLHWKLSSCSTRHCNQFLKDDRCKTLRGIINNSVLVSRLLHLAKLIIREKDISALHHRCDSSWKIDKTLVFLTASPGNSCMFIFMHLSVREWSFHSLKEYIKPYYLCSKHSVLQRLWFTFPLPHPHWALSPEYVRRSTRLSSRSG